MCAIFGELIMNNTSIQEMLKDIERVMEAVHSVVETMQIGDRKQLKQLAQDVGTLVAKDPREVFGFVNHFAHNTNIAYVSRGKNGGIIKGIRPAKTVKVSKKVKVANPVTE
jgi:hypothetical protein